MPLVDVSQVVKVCVCVCACVHVRMLHACVCVQAMPCMLVHMCEHMRVCVCVCVCTFLFCVPFSLSVCLSLSVRQTVYLSICLPFCLSVCLSLSLSVCNSINRTFNLKSDYFSIYKCSNDFVYKLLSYPSCSQAKPFAVMPGSGMAIEVSLKTAEKVSNAAICCVHVSGPQLYS